MADRKPPFADREKAAAAGRKGAAHTAALKRRRKNDPLFAVKEALPTLMRDLLAAARGEGAWKELPLQQRLGALQKCIEYALGKPEVVSKSSPPAPEEQKAPEGISIL